MKQTNAAQKRWMADIAEFIGGVGLGVLFPGYESRNDMQLHHVLGRSAKHNKIAIGHWFILPVPVELHDVASNHTYNVTHHKRFFTLHYGMQSALFAELVEMMREDAYELPPIEVLTAIDDTKE